MNNDEHERLLKQFRRIGLTCFSFSFLYVSLRDFEKDPTNKAFSRAVAFASVGYIVLQLADAFARVKNTRSVVLDIISIFCGVTIIVTALVAIFFLFFFY